LLTLCFVSAIAAAACIVAVWSHRELRMQRARTDVVLSRWVDACDLAKSTLTELVSAVEQPPTPGDATDGVARVRGAMTLGVSWFRFARYYCGQKGLPATLETDLAANLRSIDHQVTDKAERVRRAKAELEAFRDAVFNREPAYAAP
jgi:hypothetical protein